MTDGRPISLMYEDLLQTSHRNGQRTQDGTPWENKNKWLNKGNNASLIHWEQMQSTVKIGSICLWCGCLWLISLLMSAWTEGPGIMRECKWSRIWTMTWQSLLRMPIPFNGEIPVTLQVQYTSVKITYLGAEEMPQEVISVCCSIWGPKLILSM